MTRNAHPLPDDDAEALDYWDGNGAEVQNKDTHTGDDDESSRWFGYLAVALTLVSAVVGLIVFALAAYALLRGL